VELLLLLLAAFSVRFIPSGFTNSIQHVAQTKQPNRTHS